MNYVPSVTSPMSSFEIPPVMGFIDRCQVLFGRLGIAPERDWSVEIEQLLSSAPAPVMPAEQLVVRAVVDKLLEVCRRRGIRVPLGSEPRVVSTSARNAGPVRIRAALRLIDEHHSESGFSMEALARLMNMSRWHLSRQLSRLTGHHVRWHLAVSRVRHAERLLAMPTLSIKQVAAHAGFATTSELDRHFRRLHGVTPSEYRSKSLQDSSRHH